MQEKTLGQHLVSASKYSLTSAGLASFTFYLLTKRAGLQLDEVEAPVFIAILTYTYNMIAVILKKKVWPRFQSWLNE